MSGELSQFIVHDRKQLLGGFGIAFLNTAKDDGEFSHERCRQRSQRFNCFIAVACSRSFSKRRMSVNMMRVSSR